MQIDRLIRSKRRTIALIVRPDGSLEVRAPLRMSDRQVAEWVETKSAWIREKQTQARERQPAPAAARFVEGQSFPYLGVEYPLHIVDVGRGLRFDGAFYLPSRLLPRAAAAFKAWYVAQARQMISARVAGLSVRLGLDYQRIRIMSARTRWGSCSSRGSLSFNWRLVMAPPDVMDYVILHELAHLRVHNHSRVFWDTVAAWMPGYKSHRDWLKNNAQRLYDCIPDAGK